VFALLQDADAGLTVEQVAARLGLHANTARKHLDGLVEIGVATSESAPTGGRGRPARKYVASGDADPDGRVRDYAALATALAGHLARTSSDTRQEALDAGDAWGRSMTSGQRPGSAVRARKATINMLGDLGFAPERGGAAGRVRLTRCPLLDAAREHPDVVCAVHLGLVRGALDHLGGDAEGADLLPFAEPGACVLQLTPSTR
jgi:predicted ArsR family transcriptional regulator